MKNEFQLFYSTECNAAHFLSDFVISISSVCVALFSFFSYSCYCCLSFCLFHRCTPSLDRSSDRRCNSLTWQFIWLTCVHIMSVQIFTDQYWKLYKRQVWQRAQQTCKNDGNVKKCAWLLVNKQSTEWHAMTTMLIASKLPWNKGFSEMHHAAQNNRKRIMYKRNNANRFFFVSFINS